MAQAAAHIDQATVNQLIELLLWLIQSSFNNTALGYGRVLWYRIEN
jgi:hypothetical protein